MTPLPHRVMARRREVPALALEPCGEPTPALRAGRFTELRVRIDLADAALTAGCERTIRDGAPCISCSTRFPGLSVERA